MSASARGSSPLARGLLVGAGQVHVAPGIIPARAGFTQPVTQKRRVPSDHPRSRGVYLTMMWMWSPPFGSSPLARGLLDVIVFDEAQIRIIPARAGFTAMICPFLRCGHGSSPLARGLPTAADGQELLDGIIPARAGFTGRPRQPGPVRPDHPRSRGVYGPGFRSRFRSWGSSPLARGLRPRTLTRRG